MILIMIYLKLSKHLGFIINSFRTLSDLKQVTMKPSCVHWKRKAIRYKSENTEKRKGMIYTPQLQNLVETGTVSGSQAIRRFKNGTLHAASDPRKGGLAAAY